MAGKFPRGSCLEILSCGSLAVILTIYIAKALNVIQQFGTRFKHPYRAKGYR
jgi:hypothetical protein